MRQLADTSLLLKIMFHFTCREKKICSTIKKAENIMNMIVFNFFMPFLIVLIVKTSHIFAVIYFSFSRNILNKVWKSFNAKFGPQLKDCESSYQVIQILVLFCKLVDLILGWNFSVKKNCQKNEFWMGIGRVRSKRCFQRHLVTKYLR